MYPARADLSWLRPAISQHTAHEAQSGLLYAQRGGFQEGRDQPRAVPGPVRCLPSDRGRQSQTSRSR